MKKRFIAFAGLLLASFMLIGCGKKVNVEKLSKAIDKDITLLEETKEGISFNIVAEDIAKEDIKSIVEKVYQQSFQEKWGANTISFNILKDGTEDNVGFYKDGLISKVIISKEGKYANVWTYDKKPSVPDTMNETVYAVNDAVNQDGVLSVKLNIAEKDLSKVTGQINYLSKAVKELNKDKEIKEVIFDVNPNEDTGLGFSSEFNDILAQKETIRFE